MIRRLLCRLGHHGLDLQYRVFSDQFGPGDVFVCRFCPHRETRDGEPANTRLLEPEPWDPDRNNATKHTSPLWRDLAANRRRKA
jgi:hypothetical protein